MKIEHLTLGGNSLIRDSNSIADEVKRYFSAIDIGYESKLYLIPNIPFKIKVTVAEEGSIFDLQKEGNPAITNICCFKSENSEIMMDHVIAMQKAMSFIYKNDPVSPSKDHWIYSILVNPFMKPDEAILAGEIELYIYERIFQAWQKSKKS